eukprot:TRINITY_DN3913_c0_g1_i1.p1 TRINITY_DN3913_c0_g1~~TRINITY_DN3913_c0_g1_i1.p1  ORF type:complete len:306 (-),score=49.01 TRINITY_DN3913_c0_g1_i1:195-1112(-)
MAQVVNPQAVPPTIPQQCWSTESCSSVNTHHIENDDRARMGTCVNPQLKEGMMRYNNMLPQNITQVNTGTSESTVFDQLSYVQQQLGNFSTGGDNQRLNTGCASVPLKGQHGGIPQPVINSLASSTLPTYQQYQCWSTASTCSNQSFSVKDEDLTIPLKNVPSPAKEQITICNFPVEVKVIQSEDKTMGFNHKRTVGKGVENFNFDRQKSRNRLTGFNPKQKVIKTTEMLRNKDLSSKEPEFFNKKHKDVCNISLNLASKGKVIQGQSLQQESSKQSIQDAGETRNPSNRKDCELQMINKHRKAG